MPFGLRDAAQSFQRFIHEVLRGLDFCYAYVDDILVFSKNEIEHENHLAKLFQRLDKYGLIINQNKCTFGAKQVSFLGCIVSEKNVSPTQEKVAAIRKYKLPETVNKLRQFLD